jgi:protein subunit release factor A
MSPERRRYGSRVIDTRDLKIDVWRTSDARGGTDRVVRVTHIPSGIAAVSQGKASEADDRAAAIAEIEEKLKSEAL